MEPIGRGVDCPDGGLLDRVGGVGLAAAVVWALSRGVCGPLGETCFGFSGCRGSGLKEMSRGRGGGAFALVGVLAVRRGCAGWREPGVGFARALAMVGAAAGCFWPIVRVGTMDQLTQRWFDRETTSICL